MSDDDDQTDMFELEPGDLELIGQVIDQQLTNKWPKDFAALMDCGAAALRHADVPADKASEYAGRVLHAASIYAAGRQLYMPQGVQVKTAMRDRRLFHDWKEGMNADGLTRKYKISYQRVIQIVGEQRALWLAEIQPRLPGMDE